MTAVELPKLTIRRGTVHLRRTRRRGHDLASVTLTCAVDDRRDDPVAYGSLGPRPLLVVDDTGVLADPAATEDGEAGTSGGPVRRMPARPRRSMRASPDYRLAMLHVLGLRAVREAAIARLAAS